MEQLIKIYMWLVDNNYFTERELNLITKMYGFNFETLNLACKVRYAQDVFQLLEAEEEENQ